MKNYVNFVVREATPYMDRIAVRREAITKGDEELYDYSFSIAFDREKHIDHERLLKAVRTVNFQLVSDGREPLCSEDRREAARFCCIAAGREELVNYVD